MQEIKYLLNLFSIANRYDFAQVRQYAIRTIEKIQVEAGTSVCPLHILDYANKHGFAIYVSC